MFNVFFLSRNQASTVRRIQSVDDANTLYVLRAQPLWANRVFVNTHTLANALSLVYIMGHRTANCLGNCIYIYIYLYFTGQLKYTLYGVYQNKQERALCVQKKVPQHKLFTLYIFINYTVYVICSL